MSRCKRPLLLLGVLLVVGIQFLSLALSELLTSQHRERLRALDDRRRPGRDPAVAGEGALLRDRTASLPRTRRSFLCLRRAGVTVVERHRDWVLGLGQLARMAVPNGSRGEGTTTPTSSWLGYPGHFACPAARGRPVVFNPRPPSTTRSLSRSLPAPLACCGDPSHGGQRRLQGGRPPRRRHGGARRVLPPGLRVGGGAGRAVVLVGADEPLFRPGGTRRASTSSSSEAICSTVSRFVLAASAGSCSATRRI